MTSGVWGFRSTAFYGMGEAVEVWRALRADTRPVTIDTALAYKGNGWSPGWSPAGEGGGWDGGGDGSSTRTRVQEVVRNCVLFDLLVECGGGFMLGPEAGGVRAASATVPSAEPDPPAPSAPTRGTRDVEPRRAAVAASRAIAAIAGGQAGRGADEFAQIGVVPDGIAHPGLGVTRTGVDTCGSPVPDGVGLRQGGGTGRGGGGVRDGVDGPGKKPGRLGGRRGGRFAWVESATALWQELGGETQPICLRAAVRYAELHWDRLFGTLPRKSGRNVYYGASRLRGTVRQGNIPRTTRNGVGVRAWRQTSTADKGWFILSAGACLESGVDGDCEQRGDVGGDSGQVCGLPSGHAAEAAGDAEAAVAPGDSGAPLVAEAAGAAGEAAVHTRARDEILLHKARLPVRPSAVSCLSAVSLAQSIAAALVGYDVGHGEAVKSYCALRDAFANKFRPELVWGTVLVGLCGLNDSDGSREEAEPTRLSLPEFTEYIDSALLDARLPGRSRCQTIILANYCRKARSGL